MKQSRVFVAEMPGLNKYFKRTISSAPRGFLWLLNDDYHLLTNSSTLSKVSSKATNLGILFITSVILHEGLLQALLSEQIEVKIKPVQGRI